MQTFLHRLAVVAAVAAYAAPAGAQFTGGVKSGVGTAGYTGAHEFAWRLTGPNTTLFLNWASGARTSQQVEIGESHRIGLSTSGGSTLTFSASYLDMLLMTKLDFGRTLLGVRPFVLIGPTLKYGTRCNLEFSTGGLTSNTSCDDAGGGGSRLDVGLAAAGGVGFRVGPTTLSAELRGSTSFRSAVVPLESTRSYSVAWSGLFGLSVPVDFKRRAVTTPVGEPPMPRLPALDPIRVDAISEPRPAPVTDALSATGVDESSKKITLTAVDADARSLLLAIAREAGLSLVVSNDVRARVSVEFKDASPGDAMRAIISEAGLTVAGPPAERTLPTVVYYQLPVNVNEAPAEAIAARFGVSAELAKWLVESRSAPARPDGKP